MSGKVHLKGLNGIRAIAALAVIIFHIGADLASFGFSFTTKTDLGGFGVSMFFALSGFLITYLLLMEKGKWGDIDVKSFYIRRVLRILPLYYFYLLLAVITMVVYMPKELPGSLAYYLFFTANIPYVFGTALPLLVHYWSLGVEEQFYLFWPWVVKRAGQLFRFLVIFTVAFILIKLYFRYIYDTVQWPYLLWHVTRFDCMTIGALGAVLFIKRNPLFLRLSFSWISQVIAWGVILLVLFNRYHLASVVDSEIIAAITVILIVNQVANPKNLLNLETRVFDFLGKISYGMYVYHPLVIFFTKLLLGSFLLTVAETPRFIFVFTFIPLAVILISYISYQFFERKFLLRKTKYSRINSLASA